ncbi:MAG: regulator [Rhodospirillaceae bacterium]|nr:regulator [Rhodospirillaceae bacterium]|tara:strand:- start:2471 stop:3022 length:552 start_codon:yes stop_codon:yes gene_type:complete
MAKRPRKITLEYLDKAALFYLERYASSSENLKTVLRRKVWRSAREHEVDQEQAEVWIGETVARLQQGGWLDDQAWADMRVRSLRYKGESARSIRMKLAAKGIDEETATRALAQDEPDNSDIAAAISYARRRRMGPYRTGDDREERRERDMAALARKGFGLDLTRRVIDAEDEEALEELLAEVR